ncbi:hypothetical protein DFS33DRAFT_1298069 [Desarmillaria ectypa]|nr:hypothetical protein DFS33DRAFT_1298069 [Desarmillaria ectypa]
MYMPPPPVPYPGFNATGRTRMTSAAAGLSGGQSFMMTGMQFNAGDQFEASGAQSSQYMSLPQNRGSTSFSQVPQGYYNQNGALPQAWNVPYGTNGSSQIVHPYSQDPSVVDRYRDRGQHKLAFNNRPTGSMTARLLWRQSLLKYVHRAGGKMNPYHRWFIANGSEIMLLVSLHTQRPGALYSTGAVSTHVPSFTLREVLNEDEKRVVYRRVLTILATVLAKHERTVASNHSMGGVSYMQNGSNGFQRSADNFAGPSRHSLPTPARTPVQPDAAIHAPAPAPVITAENTGTVGTLPVNNASPTPLAQPESPGIRNEDSGEDGPELPPCPTSPIDRPPTPLVDENPADTADNQVKTEEQKSGGTSERPHSAVITDMPWFKEHFASVHQEQRVASTSTTSAGDHCTTDDDGAADDLEYDCVFNEFMVNDEDEDENADDKCLFGSPLLSQKDADEDGSSSLPKEDADDAEFKGLS